MRYIRERIVFTAALVCGHFKSTLYSEYLAWSSGIQPPDVSDIDYRHKEPGRPPNRYCVRISPRHGQDVVRGVEHIPMADWGMGIFKLGACDYCDDIVGETADVSLGDAWLDPFMADWQGANLAIARSPLAARLIEEGEAAESSTSSRGPPTTSPPPRPAPYATAGPVWRSASGTGPARGSGHRPSGSSRCRPPSSTVPSPSGC